MRFWNEIDLHVMHYIQMRIKNGENKWMGIFVFFCPLLVLPWSCSRITCCICRLHTVAVRCSLFQTYNATCRNSCCKICELKEHRTGKRRKESANRSTAELSSWTYSCTWRRKSMRICSKLLGIRRYDHLRACIVLCNVYLLSTHLKVSSC